MPSSPICGPPLVCRPHRGAAFYAAFRQCAASGAPGPRSRYDHTPLWCEIVHAPSRPSANISKRSPIERIIVLWYSRIKSALVPESQVRETTDENIQPRAMVRARRRIWPWVHPGQGASASVSPTRRRRGSSCAAEPPAWTGNSDPLLRRVCAPALGARANTFMVSRAFDEW